MQKKTKKEEGTAAKPDVLGRQKCPMCGNNNLTLTESEMEVPYFGKTYLFSMTCSSCKYHKADVESVEQKEASRYTFEVQNENDLKARVVKSSEATVKIPHVATIEPGAASNGYITNIEGVINRVKNIIQSERDSDGDDDGAKKKAKNLLKKLERVLWGREKLKIIIEDPSGNSAIISERAEIAKIK